MGSATVAHHDPISPAENPRPAGQSWLQSTDKRALIQFARMFDDTSTLVGVFNEHDALCISNRAFRQALHIGANEQPSWADLMRRNYALGRGTRINTDDFDKWLSSAVSRRAKLKSRTFETDLWDGRWFLMHETAHPSGWLLCVACDITLLRTSERRLRVDRDGALIAAQTDELTGISNRRHILGLLDAMLNGTNSTEQISGFACLIDIDHFKSVNDTFGHQSGDDVLVAVSQCIRKTIRTCDGLGRVGGEEFLLLIATDNRHVALEIVQRLLFKVENLRPLGDETPAQVTFSGGFAAITDEFRSKDIYARCDELLYRAKKDGRNRICLDDETTLTAD